MAGEGEREPRLPRLRPEDVEGEARTVLDELRKARGNVPNLFRVAANRPAIMASLYTHMNAVMGQGTVPQLLKELVALRVSHLNACRY